MNKKTVGILLLTLICGTTVPAAVLATYDFTGNPGNAATSVSATGSNLSASSMTFGAGLTPLEAVDTMGATGFSTGGAAGALNIANNDYWEFTLTPSEGYSLSIDSITFSYVRAGNGPQNLVFRTSADSYAADAALAQTGIAAGVQNLSFTLLSLTDLSGALTLRLYGYGATTGGSSGQLRKESLFTVNGSVAVSSVPEPATAGLLLGGVGLVFTLGRRRAVRQAV